MPCRSAAPASIRTRPNPTGTAASAPVRAIGPFGPAEGAAAAGSPAEPFFDPEPDAAALPRPLDSGPPVPFDARPVPPPPPAPPAFPAPAFVAPPPVPAAGFPAPALLAPAFPAPGFGAPPFAAPPPLPGPPVPVPPAPLLPPTG